MDGWSSGYSGRTNEQTLHVFVAILNWVAASARLVIDPVLPTVHEYVTTEPPVASEYSFVNNEQTNSRVTARRNGCSLNERASDEPEQPSILYEPSCNVDCICLDERGLWHGSRYNGCID
jgi:hypothetical protein